MARFRPTVVLTYLLKHVGRIAQLAAGVLLILVGFAGLALPILPGWGLIALGIVLVAPKSRVAKWLKRVFAWLKGLRRSQSHASPGKTGEKGEA